MSTPTRRRFLCGVGTAAGGAGLAATDRGNYTLTYCGYGHAFMDLPGALVMR